MRKALQNDPDLNNARFGDLEGIAAGKLVDNEVNSGVCLCSRLSSQGLLDNVEIKAADINFRNILCVS